MSRVPFSKLGLKKVEDVEVFNYNGLEIEVKKYLPVAEKLELIAAVMNASADENNFMNPIKVDILSHLNIIYYYTNISFTEKQKEDPTKLYDLLETNGIINMVVNLIPKSEYTNLIEDIDATIQEFYKYKNSALGIMEVISADYSNLTFDSEQIQKNIADPNNLTLVKDIIEKIG